MPGVVTEEEVARSYLRKIGAKGGRANSAAQRKARLKGIDVMLSKRGLTRGKVRKK